MNKFEWLSICKAYCKKYGYDLVFANEKNLDLGFEYKGQFYHLNIWEMKERMENENDR